MNIDTLLNRLREVDISGMGGLAKEQKRLDNGEVITLKLLRLINAFKRDEQICIEMLVDPAGRDGDIVFLARLDKSPPFDRLMTIYMDANAYCRYGGHSWTCEDNAVDYLFCMPCPANDGDFPDVATLQRVLVGIYKGMLFIELNLLSTRVSHDNTLSEDEKKARTERLFKWMEQLLGPKIPQSEAS